LDFGLLTILFAAMNPSPTGSRNGRSTAAETQRYLNKISGPLLDRIDIHVEVPAVKHEYLLKQGTGEPSAVIRERVLKARTVQTKRFEGKRKVRCNAQMGSKDLKAYTTLGLMRRRI
jgi:magnesium chelatase family protein